MLTKRAMTDIIRSHSEGEEQWDRLHSIARMTLVLEPTVSKEEELHIDERGINVMNDMSWRKLYTIH